MFLYTMTHLLEIVSLSFTALMSYKVIEREHTLPFPLKYIIIMFKHSNEHNCQYNKQGHRHINVYCKRSQFLKCEILIVCKRVVSHPFHWVPIVKNELKAMSESHRIFVRVRNGYDLLQIVEIIEIEKIDRDINQ